VAYNQLSVDATLSSGADDYLNTGSDNVTATVSVTNEKISITLPQARALNCTSSNLKRIAEKRIIS